MLESIKDLFNDHSFFTFCAFAGSGLWIVQFILVLFGLNEGDDLEGGDFKPTKAFKWLSLQTLAGFLMLFGWTAITCQKEFSCSLPVTLLFSFAAGALTVWMTRLIFKGARKFQSTGNIYRLEDAVGKEAFVYQRIPAHGVGKISLSLHHITHEIDAISSQAKEIPSFTRVQVINKKDDHTVVVHPL